MRDDYHREVRRLRDRIEELEAENAMLLGDREREALRMPPDWPRLTGCETRTFAMLLQREWVAEDAILTVSPGRSTSDRWAATYIFRIRRKLAPFGVVIRNDYRKNYSLQDRMKWRALLLRGGAPAEAAA